jgi:hypothetical protein
VARSPIGGSAVPCGRPANESFGGSCDSAQDLERDKVRPGQRVTVQVAAPAGDTGQLWITGGPDSLLLVAEDLQCAVSLDPDAEHGDGKQVPGGEDVGPGRINCSR